MSRRFCFVTMRNYKKKYLLPLVILFAATTGCFSSCFPEYTREEVAAHFFEHEKDFEELATYFDSLTKPQDSLYLVTLVLHGRSSIDLSCYPLNGSVSEKNPVIGGADLSVDSPETEEVLKKLGWSRQTLETLIGKLSAVDCKVINTTQIYRATPVEIFYRESGLGTFSYWIFDPPLEGELLDIHGKALGEKGISERTVIKYSAPL